jgi:hypothetical protein
MFADTKTFSFSAPRMTKNEDRRDDFF